MRSSICPSVAHLLSVYLATLVTQCMAKTPELGFFGRPPRPTWAAPRAIPFEIAGPPSSGASQVFSPAAGVKCWGQGPSIPATNAVAECQEAIMQVMGKFQQPTAALYEQLPRTGQPYWGGSIWRYFNEAAQVGNCAVTIEQAQSSPQQEHDMTLPVQSYTPQDITAGAGEMIDTCATQYAQLFGQRLFRLDDAFFLRVRVQRRSQAQQAPAPQSF